MMGPTHILTQSNTLAGLLLELEFNSDDIQSLLRNGQPEQVNDETFGSQEMLRNRVTAQREETAEKLANEYDDLTAWELALMDPLTPSMLRGGGLMVEDNEETFGVHQIDGRVGSGLPELLHDLSGIGDAMYIVTNVPGESVPTQREMRRAKVSSEDIVANKYPSLEPDTVQNTTGIQSHPYVDNVFEYMKLLHQNNNPFSMMLPGFHPQSGSRPDVFGGDMCQYGLAQQSGFEERSALLLSIRRPQKSTVAHSGETGALPHMDTIGVTGPNAPLFVRNQRTCSTTTAIGRMEGESEAFFACPSAQTDTFIKWTSGVRESTETQPPWSFAQHRYLWDLQNEWIPMPYQGVHSFGDYTRPQWLSMMLFGLDPRFKMAHHGNWYVIPPSTIHTVTKAFGVTAVTAWDEHFEVLERNSPLWHYRQTTPVCGDQCACEKF